MFPKWNSEPPRIKPINISTKYENMEFLGSVAAGSNLKDTLPYERILHPITLKTKTNNFHKLIDIAGDKYYMSVPTLQNVSHSIRVFEDKPPISYWNDFDKDTKNRAIDFLDRQYGHLFCDSIMSSEELSETIDFSKSPGYPPTLYGFTTKAQLITDDQFNEFMYNNFHLDQVPIWSVCPKKEFKEKNDLIALKIRLFTIPPYPLLYEQLRFGRKVSERLKLFKWSSYGFNPYNGGANILAQQIATKPVRLFYDISGWDKFLTLLNDVYGVAIRNSNVPTHLMKNFLWSLRHTMHYHFKTPSGLVFLKKYGNPSGSGTTTRDNILAHVIIIAHALFECYFNKMGFFPTHELLNEQVIKIFGDDNIMSLDMDFSLILEEGYMAQHFQKYGLKLKFFFGGINYNIEQMQFLGFNFKLINGIYYPLYDIQKLATSFIYKSDGNQSREAYMSRAFTLMVMSFPSEYFETFLGAFRDLCDNCNTQELTPIERSYHNMRNIRKQEIASLFTGQESSSTDFSFFLSCTGWRKEIKDYV